MDKSPLHQLATPIVNTIATNREGIFQLAKTEVLYLHSTNRSPFVPAESLNYDAAYFVNKHRDEMLNTFEVSDVFELPDLALALTRFSIGGTVYRRAVWFTKQDARWLISADQFVSEQILTERSWKETDPQKVGDLVTVATAWSKESAVIWFW